MRRPAGLGGGFYAVLGFLSVVAIVVAQVLDGPVVYVGAGLAAAWALFLSFRAPRACLSAGAFIVLVAGTEFRVRDPLAGVQGSVDAQIVFELGLYAFVGWLALRALVRLPRPEWRLNVLEWSLFGYLALAVASAAWSPIGTYTLIRALQLVVLFAYALVVVRTLGPDRAWAFMARSVVAFAAVFTVLGILASITGIAPIGERFGWFWTHPIAVGSHAALAGLAVLAGLLFREPSERLQKWRVIAVLVFTVVVMATLSRGPLIAYMLTAGALVATRMTSRGVATLAVVVGTAGALVILNLPGGMFTFYDALVAIPGVPTLLRDQSARDLFALTGRIELWRSLFPAFQDHPLVGHGYQVTRIVGTQIAPWAGEAHNGLLQSLVDLGLLGTLLLLAPLVAALIMNYLRTTDEATSAAETMANASRFGALLFLFVNSVGTAGFAGVPGLDPLVLYFAAAATLTRSPERWFSARRTRPDLSRSSNAHRRA